MKLRLEVSDDGIGLPAGFDLDKSESLGLRLVVALAAQLSGVLEIEGRAGTLFRVTFADQQPES